MMLGFPPLMYYLWICLVFYDGKLQGPKSFAWEDIKNFVHVFYELAAKVSFKLHHTYQECTFVLCATEVA